MIEFTDINISLWFKEKRFKSLELGLILVIIFLFLSYNLSLLFWNFICFLLWSLYFYLKNVKFISCYTWEIAEVDMSFIVFVYILISLQIDGVPPKKKKVKMISWLHNYLNAFSQKNKKREKKRKTIWMRKLSFTNNINVELEIYPSELLINFNVARFLIIKVNTWLFIIVWFFWLIFSWFYVIYWTCACLMSVYLLFDYVKCSFYILLI